MRNPFRSASRSPGRVTLDLDALTAEGRLTAGEAARLAALAVPGRTGATLVGLLYVAGALALASGVVLLKPSATTGLVLALAALGSAGLIRGTAARSLDVLAMGLATAGTLGMASWFALEFGEAVPGIAVTGFATLASLVSALAFRSRFLAALVPLGVAAMLGSSTGYWHASYEVVVREPLIASVAFAALAAALFAALPALRGAATRAWSDMALVAGRMSLMLGNIALWVGSLWGSHVGEALFAPARAKGEDWSDWQARLDAHRETLVHVPESAFTIAWLVLALLMVPLGRRIGSMFMVNAGATFVAINLYTQFFETFRFDPISLAIAGAATLGGAVLLAIRQRIAGALGA